MCIYSENYESDPLLLGEGGSYIPDEDAGCGGEIVGLMQQHDLYLLDLL